MAIALPTRRSNSTPESDGAVLLLATIWLIGWTAITALNIAAAIFICGDSASTSTTTCWRAST